MVKVHAVVHVQDSAQAEAQSMLARECGVDGVWLIDHARSHQSLLAVVERVRVAMPGFWIGVNFLDLPPDEAIAVVDDAVDGLWSDDAGVHAESDPRVRERVLEARARRSWPGTYFGGVAFKGRMREPDEWGAALAAIPFVDVVTTSGSATGVAAPVRKIRTMHKALKGLRPLAVASGITPDNVGTYLPHVEFLMVATGISKGFHQLDPEKTARLVRLVSEWGALDSTR